jgi:hypothetical protein
MLTYLLLATAVAACITPTGYALGSFITSGRIRDEEFWAGAAGEDLATGVRRFVIAHLPKCDAQEEVVIAVADLERLHELADASDQAAGNPLPPMHFTRRVLKAVAQRRQSRITERIAA